MGEEMKEGREARTKTRAPVNYRHANTPMAIIHVKKRMTSPPGFGTMPFRLITVSKNGVKLFWGLNSVNINNRVPPKKSFTPLFDDVNRRNGILPKPGEAFAFGLGETSLSFFRLRKKMAFATENWAQNGLPNRLQSLDFVDSV